MKSKKPVKDLLHTWSTTYRENIGVEYVPTWGRDLKILGDILEIISLEQTRELLQLYFSTPQSNYSIPFFKCALNELQQRYLKQNEKFLNKRKLINPDAERFHAE